MKLLLERANAKLKDSIVESILVGVVAAIILDFALIITAAAAVTSLGRYKRIKPIYNLSQYILLSVRKPHAILGLGPIASQQPDPGAVAEIALPT